MKTTTSQRLYLNIVQTDSLALSNDTFLNLYKTKIELQHQNGVQKNKITDLECLLSSLRYGKQSLENEVKLKTKYQIFRFKIINLFCFVGDQDKTTNG